MNLYHPHLRSNRVFMTLMELWLGQHPTNNALRSSKTKIPPFNPNFMTRFHQQALMELNYISPGLVINPPTTALKAVCLGFYMTANEVW